VALWRTAFLTKTANLFVVLAPGVAKACIAVPPYFIYCHFSLKLDVNSLISENDSLLSRCCSTIDRTFQDFIESLGVKSNFRHCTSEGFIDMPNGRGYSFKT
jgi:hypothetical protein